MLAASVLNVLARILLPSPRHLARAWGRLRGLWALKMEALAQQRRAEPTRTGSAHVQGFRLQVILGEEESARTLTALDVEKEVSFIKAIDSQRLKDNILSNAWEFKAMPPHMALHSKIYLLESPLQSTYYGRLSQFKPSSL